MNSIYQGNVSLSLFGESHGRAIGIVIDGFPPGFKIDFAEVTREMQRRKPGSSSLTTPRKESDAVEVVSGYFNDQTTGAPLCALIFTEDTRSKDYDALKDVVRPGHSDYSGFIHYKGANDYRGGGHFSGRLTAPLVFAGAICKQYLESQGVSIGSHILSIGSVEDRSFEAEDISIDKIKPLRKMAIPTLIEEVGVEMEAEILKAKKASDSIGGIIECLALGVKPGLGNPFFNSLESKLSSLFFSMPGVKGVSFGSGFKLAKMLGSESNDPFYYQENQVVATKTNHNGGILGGLSTGMPIVTQIVLKATPSISQNQETINLKTREETNLKIEGRHDPCIVLRAVPVAESLMAIGILDAYLEDKKWT